jgi:hypothetical protein
LKEQVNDERARANIYKTDLSKGKQTVTKLEQKLYSETNYLSFVEKKVG